MSVKFEQAAHQLESARHVVDVRNLGLVAGIELEPRKGAPGARVTEVFSKCMDKGVMIRYTGETIAVSQPLIIEEGEIDHLFQTIADDLKSPDCHPLGDGPLPEPQPGGWHHAGPNSALAGKSVP